MPHKGHKFNCCVPGCLNSFRNAQELSYYRIPKDKVTRNHYIRVLRNETLKLDSDATRVCSAHFEGGEKLSRNHLPTIFPWTKPTTKRREITRHSLVEKSKKPRVVTEEETFEVPDASANGVHVNEQQTQNDQQPQQATQTFLSSECIVRLLEMEKDYINVKAENENLKSENKDLKKQLSQLKMELKSKSVFDINKYKNSAEDITFYTGLPDYDCLTLSNLVENSAKNLSYEHEKVYTGMNNTKQFGRPRSLTTFQEYIMVLMRIRLGLFEKDLAHRFGVSQATVCRILRTWLRFLRCEFEPLIIIPPSEVTKHYMPEVFKKFYPNITTIVDCTEVEMEKPSALDNQSTCYSSYKSKNTMKALIGISPSGVINFVSDFFPGSASDKEIVIQSNFLSRLKQGDQVMADKGFNCQDELASVGATLVIPNMLKGIKQFSTEQTDHNKKVATLRIHVERMMERIKNWHIFDRRIPVVSSQLASDILIVVCALCNFHPPLIN